MAIKSLIPHLILPAAVSLLFTGCGGSDNKSASGNPAAKSGVFLDAEVGGLSYSASPSGLSGTTNPAGEFSYRDNDTLSFSFGGITVGTAAGQAIVTPRTIAASITSLPSGISVADIALNIAILLQSFDEDGNPDNGITISAVTATAAANTTINFGVLPTDFVNDPSLIQLASDTNKTIVSPDAAAEHTSGEIRKKIAGSWNFVDAGGVNDQGAIVTFFSNGLYVLGIDHSDPDCLDGLEWGSYKINAETGKFNNEIVFVDTTGPDGDCGFYERGSGLTADIVLNSDTTIALTNIDGEANDTLNLSLIPVGTSIAGSWLLDEPESDGPIVVNFFSNGKYFMTHVEDGTGGERGLERGTWAVDANTKVLTTNQTLDTNGDAGLSDIGGSPTAELTDTGRLKLTITGEEIALLDRLPLQDLSKNPATPLP
jgi:hypothetical protein